MLLHAFSSFTLGGAQSRFVQLANAFGSRYRHVVVAMDDQWQAGERLAPEVSWTALKQHVLRGGGLGNRRPFRRTLQELRPDLVLSYNWGAIEWLAANRPCLAPHVHVEDGFGPDEVAGQKGRRVWMRRVLFKSNQVSLVVPSRQLLRAAERWWVPAGRTCFIPNGVAMPVHALSVADRSGPLTIGTVAGLRPEKNVARLIRAFAAVRAQQPARLLVIGDGVERAQLEAQCEQLGVREHVEFTGYLTDPLRRLADMDLFALSSDTEQQPLSMLEAMAAGLPVVATAVGDVPLMLPELAASVALSAPNDEAFTGALLGMVARRADWSAWAAAGRQRVKESYSREQMLNKWQAVFDGTPGCH